MTIKKTPFLLFAVVLAVLSRFVWLDRVPNAIGGDELDYVLTAKSIYQNGSGLMGEWNPLSVFAFRYPTGEFPKAELPYFLLIPFVGWRPFSLFWAKLPFALTGVITVVLLYFIAKKIFGEKVGYWTAFLAALNPWSVYINRTGYESTLAIAFYLAAFLVIIGAEKRKVLWAIPLLVFGFYSYIATKLIFLPMVGLFLVYPLIFQKNRQFWRQYLLVFASCLVLVLLMFLSMRADPDHSRISEILFPWSPEVAAEVDFLRKASIENPFTTLVENKMTVYFKILTTRFYKIFSADYLFLFGDSFFSLWRHGLFYYADAVLILVGLGLLFKKKPKLLVYLIGLIIVGTLPQLFHRATTGNMAIHVCFIFPWLIILAAIGADTLLNSVKKSGLRRPVGAIVFGVYLALAVNFFHLYFFQHPLQGHFDFRLRLLSRYLVLAEKEGIPVSFYSSSSQDAFRKFLFYTDGVSAESLPQIRAVLSSGEAHFNGVDFLGCDRAVDVSAQDSVQIFDALCDFKSPGTNHLSLARFDDGGESYQIFNDRLCSSLAIDRYPTGITMGDFLIEKLGKEAFCRRLIISR